MKSTLVTEVYIMELQVLLWQTETEFHFLTNPNLPIISVKLYGVSYVFNFELGLTLYVKRVICV